MSNENQETISDIVADIRSKAAGESEAKKIIKAETEFVEDLQNGVLRPTLNLCI